MLFFTGIYKIINLPDQILSMVLGFLCQKSKLAFNIRFFLSKVKIGFELGWELGNVCEVKSLVCAGGVLSVVDEVLTRSRAGIAIVRPPGHHAEPVTLPYPTLSRSSLPWIQSDFSLP